MTPSLGPVVRELSESGGKRPRPTGRGPGEGLAGDRLDHAQGQDQEEKQVNSSGQISGWRHEKATLYRHRVVQEMDLYLAKQRKADRAALEEEDRRNR